MCRLDGVWHPNVLLCSSNIDNIVSMFHSLPEVLLKAASR